MENIANLLTTFLGRERAKQTAVWLHQDMASIGFNVVPSLETPFGYWERIRMQPEYVLPANQFGVNGPKPDEQLCGGFLTVGNLVRLAQCVEVGRKYIPHLWPQVFATALHGKEHWDSLTEVWWLKFWKGVESVNRGPKKSRDAPDFDWQIHGRDPIARYVINLEVKRRTGTLNQMFKGRKLRVEMNDAVKKFGPVPENTCNIIAVTVYQPVPKSVWDFVKFWLNRSQNDHVHGVVVWMENCGLDRPMLSTFKSSKRWVQDLLLPHEKVDVEVRGVPFGTTGSDPQKEIERIMNSIVDGGEIWPDQTA